MNFLSSFLERVVHIQLYGNVNLKMVENLRQALKNKSWYSVKLVAVSINSPGGSIVQAKNVSQILKAFSRETQAPVYTFAENYSFNAANIILTGGDKCFANKFSILGDHGFYQKKFGIKNLINDWNIQGEYIAQGKDKVKFNMFEELKDQDGKWLQDILYGLEYELKAEILKNRSQHFYRHNLTNESIEKNIFEPSAISAEDAVKYGLIDGVSTLQSLLHDKFDGIKRLDAMKRSYFEDRVPKSQATILQTIPISNQ